MNLAEHYQNILQPGQKVIYLPNYGNAGDAVIAQGTIDFFNAHSIPFEIDYNLSRIRNQHVTFGGGGGLTGAYPEPFRILSLALSQSKSLTILPSSITHLPNHLTDKLKAATIFARELKTKAILDSKLESSRVFLQGDMAFHLQPKIKEYINRNKAPLIIQCSLEGTLKQRTRALRYIPRALRSYLGIRSWKTQSGAKTLFCFRTDSESSGNCDPSRSFDISELYRIGCQTRSTINLGTSLFVETLSWFETIETDRLHCAITGAMLGKSVRFYPNNYFKNEAVYEFSIKSQFPNVEWNPPVLANN